MLAHRAREYLPNPEVDQDNPLASPMFGDFTDVCPILIHYGAKEFLAEEIEKFVEKLQGQTGMDLTTIKEPLAPHISPLLAVFFKSMSYRGVDAIADYIHARLYETPHQ
jgi:acetyl esterase/lipase